MSEPLQHHFVVFGERRADGTVEFFVDDETLMSYFNNTAIYDPNTDEWLPPSALRDDEDLSDEDSAISAALAKLFETPVRADDE